MNTEAGWLANRSSGQGGTATVALLVHFNATLWWATFASVPERRLVDLTGIEPVTS